MLNHQNIYTIKISYIKNLEEHNDGLVTPEKAGLINRGHQIEIHKKINNTYTKKKSTSNININKEKREVEKYTPCSGSKKLYLHVYIHGAVNHCKKKEDAVTFAFT